MADSGEKQQPETDPVGEDELIATLDDHFRRVLEINDELENSSLASNHPRYQELVHEALNSCEQMTEHINELGVFRTNETASEITTENLKYLLLPVLLGNFTMKNIRIDRLDALEKAKIYYKDYISRLNDYELCDIQIPEGEKSNNKTTVSSIDSLVEAAMTRNAKIQRFQQLKQLEDDLKRLKQSIMTQPESVDDDVKRDFYMKLVKRWLNHALDELAAIESEIPFVKRQAAMKTAGTKNPVATSSSRRSQQPSSFKPMVILRDNAQRAVFGSGYPSLPTYTVDQFVEKKIKEGNPAFSDKNVYKNSLYEWSVNPEQKKLEEEIEEERKEELRNIDDPIELARLRSWDDWKDEHKRGEGNRHNMG